MDGNRGFDNIVLGFRHFTIHLERWVPAQTRRVATFIGLDELCIDPERVYLAK